jgi:general secretion pathway protein G
MTSIQPFNWIAAWVQSSKSKIQNPRLRKGFTLIELLVVILIIAILAALIVPKIVGRTDQAKIATATSDIATLSAQVNAFKLDCDRYPTTDEGLTALTTPPADVQGWKGPYIEKLPLDPWKNEYSYAYPGPGGEGSFLIKSNGPPGGDGDTTAITNQE